MIKKALTHTHTKTSMGGKETGEVSYKQRKVWRYSHQMANTGPSEEEDVGWRRELSGRRKKSGKGE